MNHMSHGSRGDAPVSPERGNIFEGTDAPEGACGFLRGVFLEFFTDFCVFRRVPVRQPPPSPRSAQSH